MITWDITKDIIMLFGWCISLITPICMTIYSIIVSNYILFLVTLIGIIPYYSFIFGVLVRNSQLNERINQLLDKNLELKLKLLNKKKEQEDD